MELFSSPQSPAHTGAMSSEETMVNSGAGQSIEEPDAAEGPSTPEGGLDKAEAQGNESATPSPKGGDQRPLHQYPRPQDGNNNAYRGFHRFPQGGRGGGGGGGAHGHGVAFPPVPYAHNGWGAAQPWAYPGAQGLFFREEDVPLSRTNVYIPGLPPTATDDELQRLCEKYGRIVSAKAIVDRNTGQCKGYGFVMFEKPPQAQKAIQALKAAGYQASFAKESYTGHATNKAQQDFDSTNLYMANIPLHYTEQDLEKFLDGWGHVLSTRILRDANGISRGVGFARLETREQCDEVVRAFNQKLALTSQPLQVRYADTMQQKRQRMVERKQRNLAGLMGMPGFVPIHLLQGQMANPQGHGFFPARGPHIGVMAGGPSSWLNPMGFQMGPAPGLPLASQQQQGQIQHYGGPPSTLPLSTGDLAEQPAGLASQGNMTQLTNQMAAMSMNQMIPQMMMYQQPMGYGLAPQQIGHPQPAQPGARESQANLGA